MLKESELTKVLRGDGWIGGSTGFFEQWKYAVWHYNYGSKSLYICPNQYNVHHQEWTLRKMVIMICPYRFTSYNNVSLWWWMLIIYQMLHIYEAECIWETSVPSCEFCCELKTALKTNSLSVQYSIFDQFIFTLW